MATVYDFLNADSSEVEEQRVIRVAGTTGDVLTLQANGTVAPAPGGGAQPENAATVNVVELMSGPLTLYTPAAGEVVIADLAVVDEELDGDLSVFVLQQPITTDAIPSIAAPSTVSRFAFGPDANAEECVIVCATTTPVVAMLSSAADYPITAPVGTWQANHAYAEGDCLLVTDNVIVKAENAGTSGGSEPTWPAEGDTVVDNDITWEAFAIAPTQGIARVWVRVLPVAS